MAWERWFAWRPVRIDGKWTWLKWVERRGIHIPVYTLAGKGASIATVYEYRNEESILK